MTFFRAHSLDELKRVLPRATSTTRFLAGGTDLMVEFQSGRTPPLDVIDIASVGELRGIHETRDGLWIGALSTCTDLLRSREAAQHADVLVEAARWVGAVQIQNRATVGGNLGTASPAADLTPALYALRARVELVSPREKRNLAIEDFVTGYRTTARAPDEVIAAVIVPRAAEGERRAFRKVGTRRAQSISKVVVALAIDHDRGRVYTLRGAAGSVAARTVLLPALEHELVGRDLDAATIAHAAAASARLDISPIDDVRSNAVHRRAVFARIVTRILGDLAAPTA